MESNHQTATTPHETIQAENGFDAQDPQIGLIVGIGVATIISLAAVIGGLQAYFDHVKEVQYHEQVELPIAENFKNLRTQEDEALNSYKYVDKGAGVVQIPVARAMELLAKEAADGKLTYFAKPYAVKEAAPAAGATPAPAGSTPNAAPAGEKK